MPAKYMASLIDELDLDANPRSSKLGSVTDAIQKSIRSDESSNENLFPFKSKGILVATSYFEELDRSRFRLSFQRPDIEGILDGGHNTLDIGCYIYTEAEKALGKPAPSKERHRHLGLLQAHLARAPRGHSRLLAASPRRQGHASR